MYIVLVRETNLCEWYGFECSQTGIIRSSCPMEFLTLDEAKDFINKMPVIHEFGIFELMKN